MPDALSLSFVERILTFIFVFFTTLVAGNAVYTLIIRQLQLRAVKFSGYYFLAKLLLYGIYAFGFFYGFTVVLNFNVAEFAASFGLISLAIAFSAQQTIQNYIAGIIIMVDRPFRERDYVEHAGTVCKVIDIGLRRTRMRSLDGRIFIVPNSAFVTGTVINYTEGEYIRCVVPIPISHDSDVEKAMAVIMEACVENHEIVPRVSRKMSALETLLTIPKDMKKLEPKIFIKEINKDRVLLELWFWTDGIRRREVIISHVLKETKKRFEKNGIKFG
ncbi:MAG: mechanosensitive ion channel [Candidatus Aenigmarchaeota archaeon]|nr:mechanosensitive ion channel [Candidatus Aenigmarchaeota archaeon]